MSVLPGGSDTDLVLADRVVALFGRHRRYLTCRTCNDFGMIEAGNQEDVCPVCEGGIWRERESWLNRHPQFTAPVGDALVHFAHLRSQRDGAPALLVMHGWPHTFALQLDFADLLPDFHVVVPSFPGFGFSPPYADGRWLRPARRNPPA